MFSSQKDSVKIAKQYISGLIGSNGIASAATYYNQELNRHEVFVGTYEDSQIPEVSKFIKELINSGKIPAVFVDIKTSGRAVAPCRKEFK